MHLACLSLADLLETAMLLDSWPEYRRNIRMIVGMAIDTTIDTKPGKLVDMPSCLDATE